MPRYAYKALNAEGVPLDGDLAAGSEREAARLLERRGLSVIAVRELTVKTSARPARGERRLRTRDLILALHELSTLLASGVGLAA